MRRKIRVRVAGIFIRDQKILLVKHRKGDAEYFLLPGGGQEPGEGAQEALRREWKEELNLDANIGDFLFFGESVPPKNLRKSQVMQLVFLVNDARGKLFTEKSGALVGSEWVAVDDLNNVKLFPRCSNQLNSIIAGDNPTLYERYEWIHA